MALEGVNDKVGQSCFLAVANETPAAENVARCRLAPDGYTNALGVWRSCLRQCAKAGGGLPNLWEAPCGGAIVTEGITFSDPASVYIQNESGMGYRKLIAFAKQNRWRTCKIYGRIHICTQDYKAWLDAKKPVQPCA